MNSSARDFEDKLFALLPRLRGFCFALCGAAHDADDLMQSTVERLLVKPPPSGADPARWMFRVCKNLWIDEVRARKVRRAEPLDPEMDIAGPDGELTMLDHLMVAKVNQAMAVLPEEQRVIIALIALEGFSYREAAETLEIPVGTVMSRLSRARATLADALQPSVSTH